MMRFITDFGPEAANEKGGISVFCNPIAVIGVFKPKNGDFYSISKGMEFCELGFYEWRPLKQLI